MGHLYDGPLPRQATIHVAPVPNAAFGARAPFAGCGVGFRVARMRRDLPSHGATPMLTLAVILLVLWLLGLVSSYTIGGLIHILLIAAIVIFLVRAFQGRRPIV
jgi:hypothetical protein